MGPDAPDGYCVSVICSSQRADAIVVWALPGALRRDQQGSPQSTRSKESLVGRLGYLRDECCTYKNKSLPVMVGSLARVLD